MTIYTKDQLELKAHIEKLNKKHMEKVRANTNPNIQYCTVPEIVPFSKIDDLAEKGIVSVLDYKKDECKTWISEMGKSATGSRIRVDTDEHTLEELEDMCSYWSEQAKVAEEEQQQAYKKSISDFAKRIKDTCKLGAKDYRTAIRWILQADDINNNSAYDGDDICFDFGLPFKYKSLFKTAGVV